jgi:hypothetical protein
MFQTAGTIYWLRIFSAKDGSNFGRITPPFLWICELQTIFALTKIQWLKEADWVKAFIDSYLRGLWSTCFFVLNTRKT